MAATQYSEVTDSVYSDQPVVLSGPNAATAIRAARGISQMALILINNCVAKDEGRTFLAPDDEASLLDGIKALADTINKDIETAMDSITEPNGQPLAS